MNQQQQQQQKKERREQCLIWDMLFNQLAVRIRVVYLKLQINK
jgi:hypothetical protein